MFPFQPVVNDDVTRFPVVRESAPVFESHRISDICEGLPKDGSHFVVLGSWMPPPLAHAGVISFYIRSVPAAESALRLRGKYVNA